MDTFRDVPGIAHYEVRPDAEGGCALRYIADWHTPEKSKLDELNQRLMALLGLNQPVVVEPVDTLVPTASGKFRLTAPAA